MIRYALKCADDHHFEMWFKDSATFNSLVENAMVQCPDCGSADVEKTLMAPAVPQRQNPQTKQPSPREIAAPRCLKRQPMSVGAFLKRRARCIMAMQSNARSAEKRRQTKPERCMKMGSKSCPFRQSRPRRTEPQSLSTGICACSTRHDAGKRGCRPLGAR